MGRPKQYANATARQAAYRARVNASTQWVNREPYEQTQMALERLYQAIWHGVRQGDSWAQTLYRPTPEALAIAVADWFTDYYTTVPAERRAQMESSRHEILHRPD